jgi:NAD-dependent DNA ligase
MSIDELDAVNRAINRSVQNRIDTRAMQTLIGICSGMAADQAINDKEIAYLQTWLSDHQSIRDQWPASAIHCRIQDILADGIITGEEREDLLAKLQELTGNYFNDTGSATIEGPAMPLDDDPSIFFRNMSYCFTGEFLYGTRAACERVVLRLGAMALSNVTKRLNYLVIGSNCSPAWTGETYGRKIEQAVRYREEGHEICIISEKQWTHALLDADRP